MSDPKRWKQDPDAPPQVRALLGRANRPPPLDRHVRRAVGATLLSLLTKKAAAAALGTKVALALLVGGGGGIVAMHGTVEEVVGDPAPPDRPAVQRPRGASAANAAPAAASDDGLDDDGAPSPGKATVDEADAGAARLAEAAQDADTTPRSASTGGPSHPRSASVARPPRPQAQRTPRTHRPSAAAATGQPEPQTDDRATSLAGEARLLERARTALDGDPAGALRAVRVHQRRFPQGQLAAERELIAVDALQRLGRARDARRRIEAWLAAHPDGLYARRMRRMGDSLPE